MISNTDIMCCIDQITRLLPQLRDSLDLTQREFASIIGISRQSVINLEHQKQKITRAVLLAMIAFFSLREKSARILYDNGFYTLKYVDFIGFTASLIRQTFDFDEVQI